MTQLGGILDRFGGSRKQDEIKGKREETGSKEITVRYLLQKGHFRAKGDRSQNMRKQTILICLC